MNDAHNQAAADELLNLAANDPALDDDQFALVSRVLRGEQISSEAVEPTASRYFVDLDGGGDLTLWIGTGPDDPNCQPVARKFKLDAEDPVLWPTVVQALTGQAADGGAS
jgi:hypothetical protein